MKSKVLRSAPRVSAGSRFLADTGAGEARDVSVSKHFSLSGSGECLSTPGPTAKMYLG